MTDLIAATPAGERPGLVLYAAGSLRQAFEELLPAFRETGGAEVRAVLGPAGLLRGRIEGGEAADVFASANMAHPQRLFELGRFERPACFARNRICAIARADLNLATGNCLERLLDPAVRLGTSTPGADPSGDYALAVFERIDAIVPGAGAVLRAKARHLVGGAVAPKIPGGRAAAEWFISTGVVDLFLGYATSARLSAGDAGLAIVELPADFAVTADYGVAPAIAASDAARGLVRFILSAPGQEILGKYGFLRAQSDDH
jgi:molybdate transport system substrate-binding protein